MLTVAPMIKNLSSTAGSLLDKHNTRDLFFSSSEPASPFQASSGPHNQQEQQEKQALSPFHQQRGSFLSDEACRLVNMPPPPSSSAPPPSSDTYNTVHYGQQPLQNHIKTAVTYPHVPSSQDTTENQEEQPQPPGPIKALKAEQTTEQSSHTDIVEPKDVKPLGRPKRGNRERSLLGIPQSTSGSTSELSSSSLSLQSLSSSGSSSTSQSKEGTTRRMLLRGVHKKLSVLPGSNTADITRTHSTPPIEKSTIVLTDSSTNSQASPAILNKDTSALSNTSSLGEDSGPDSVLGRLPIGDQTPLSSTVNSGVSLPARKAQVGSPATGSRASSLSLEHYQIMDDDGCTDAGPKGTKRRANTPVPFAAPPRNNGSRRRTSSPGEDTTKKLKVHDHRNNGKLLTHSPKTASNGLQGERRPNFPKGLFSVTGDEYALKVRIWAV
ncbi:hypothetical protein B0O80DRAFT_210901 [Mortierella sp. GBAus27b]|nr:hypothetical protein B0O80DRAFT_210901 [Mortierella sp. GBAus27b]